MHLVSNLFVVLLALNSVTCDSDKCEISLRMIKKMKNEMKNNDCATEVLESEQCGKAYQELETCQVENKQYSAYESGILHYYTYPLGGLSFPE